MENRYPILFYENLFTATIVQSPNDKLKIANILAPLWPRYQIWKCQREKEKRRRYAIFVIALVVMVATIRMWPDLQWWIFAHVRIGITLLPRWSGVRLSNNDCLIPNIPQSFLGGVAIDDQENKFMNGECWNCELIKDARRLDISNLKMISQFAAWSQPILISMKNHTSKKLIEEMTMEDVMEEVGIPYHHRPDAEPCHFVTNFPHAFEEFLIRYADYVDQPWFAQWQNCDHDTTKALRVLHRRPEFLPRSFSTMGASWIFLASNYEARVFRELDITEPWFWMTQLNGQGRLHLKPKSKCQSICQNIEIDLEPEIFALIPTSLWTIGYMPKYNENLDSIAFGVESYQEMRM